MKEKARAWSNKQKIFRSTLLAFEDLDQSKTLFMDQHAFLHTKEVEPSVPFSYADALLDTLDDNGWRRVPSGEEHSIAWCIWHLARIEDVTMNLLVAGRSQLFLEEDWQTSLEIDREDTGNSMNREEIFQLSTMINIESLKLYRDRVGLRTREIVEGLSLEHLRMKVAPADIDRIMQEGALIEDARGIADYWLKRNIAGLLLMPPTRHALVHLNEIARIKKRK